MTRPAQHSPVGTLLREWRQRRRLSQLDLALAAGSSARHLSCIETGRARPSRAMVLTLCEALDVPLRERNTVLLAGGFAPEYRERDLGDADMAAARAALSAVLTAHEPYPAVAVDRYWNVVATNRTMGLFEDEIPAHLAAEPLNVYRLALYPGDPSTAYMVNYAQVREYLLDRLLRQVRATGDPALRDLYDEVSAYPMQPEDESDSAALPSSPFSVPLRIRTPHGELRLFSTMVTFGAPADVTLAELAVELFYPLDDATAVALRALAEPRVEADRRG
ncbi:transcriptional regulator, y4mF family [Nocardia otitidiscaviarum]|uniref:Transcriptional regulator, y4mF family n=1 Tax=Nocardia otitidiscaviarum TaxID=1823 RepID=A0A378YTZ7_9NOCA|nr:helix-turn-helix transcriptional regulator [Nocardia otitidiscaviarum]MBF6237199.1 helix-turn-helix transcriptional regulator [Nocardia otitidiscaviarum]SUA80594.1 transcriptional regulator, y4mF family [Nocardia otitidiscaviarum]